MSWKRFCVTLGIAVLALLLIATSLRAPTVEPPAGACAVVTVASFGRLTVATDSTVPAAMIGNMGDTVTTIGRDRFVVPTFPKALLCTVRASADGTTVVPAVIRLRF